MIQINMFYHTYNTHKTIDVIINNVLYAIDEKIAMTIAKLNDMGIQTLYSCQGGNGETAYVGFVSMPIELRKAFERNKCRFLFEDRVYAKVPFDDESNKQFIDILIEWTERRWKEWVNDKL